MGPSRTRLPLFLGILLLFFGRDCYAATINYDFNVTWLTTNPDGLAERPTIGINGQWPIPQIEANVGDRIIIDLHNQLGNESTSLHFHGLFMNGTTEMDGVSQVSQCAVPPGSSFTYNFTVEQAGTYWYHSHFKGQYPDGLRGPLIIHDPDDPHLEEYEEEFVITLSDWYHDQMPGLIAWFISIANPTGAEPVPDSALMNETQDFKLPVQAGKTYRLRLVNIGAFAGQYFWIESHTMTIIEVDGVRTQNAEADMIYLTAAQRYDVLVTTKNDISTNFAMVGSMDQDLFDTIPDTLNPNVTGWLVYDDKKDLPSASLVEDFDPFDDFTLIALDGMELLDHVDRTVTLDLKMDNLGDGANYAFFNDITYVSPKVPSLYTALTTGTNATNPAVYGVNSNAFIMSQGEVVEIVLNNDDAGKHPFHLHGHNFQAVVRSDENGGFYDASNMTAMPAVPMRRDVFLVRPQGHIVLRYRADNPGIWLFHCHIEWHVDSGLVATMVEAPLALQDTLTISQDHLAVCAAGNVPTRGNAAGNTDDVLDLTGANVSPPPLPAGFTARGVVALVFSCIAAFLGMAAIVWYGAAPLGPKSAAAAQQRVVEITGGR